MHVFWYILLYLESVLDIKCESSYYNFKYCFMDAFVIDTYTEIQVAYTWRKTHEIENAKCLCQEKRVCQDPWLPDRIWKSPGR